MRDFLLSFVSDMSQIVSRARVYIYIYIYIYLCLYVANVNQHVC